jgi:hypothetical protein
MTTPRHPETGQYVAPGDLPANATVNRETGVVSLPGGGGYTDHRLRADHVDAGPNQPCCYDPGAAIAEPPGMESASWDGLPSAEVVA